MSSTAAGSSLEDLLDSLVRRNCPKPKDMPPALPARPTSRTRLPSNRRAALPEIVEAVMELSSLHHSDSKGSSKWKSIGVKKVNQVKEDESLYPTAASDESTSGEKLYPTAGSDESTSGEKLASSPPGSSFRESDWHENMEYFIKEV